MNYNYVKDYLNAGKLTTKILLSLMYNHACYHFLVKDN